MNLKNRLTILLFATTIVALLDRSTKFLATEYLPRGLMRSYFYDILRIGYSENRGALLGLGNNLPAELRFWIFTIGVGLILFLLLGYILMETEQTTYTMVGFSMIFSGGINNLYDRIVNNGAVVDFLNLGMGPIRTGIFNVADMAIFVGIPVLLLAQSRSNSAK